MVRIRFRYVGQGDCIIIEGAGAGASDAIGIIDCNQRGCTHNHAVSYLEAKGPAEIAFIMMTHPHADHYSGLVGILEYCERTSTPIGLFGHTSSNVPAFLRAASKTTADERALDKLLKEAIRLFKTGLIKRMGRLTDMTAPIHLDENHHLTFVAPRDEDLRAYEAQVYGKGLRVEAKANANLLSLVTRLHTPFGYVLLTADVERDVLKGIEPALADGVMLSGQVPHHGSGKNHERRFWIRRSKSEIDQPLALSVGPNIYDHPDTKVIRDFGRLGYPVATTWIPPRDLRSQAARALDLVSTVIGKSAPDGEDVVLECSGGTTAVLTSHTTFSN